MNGASITSSSLEQRQALRPAVKPMNGMRTDTPMPPRHGAGARPATKHGRRTILGGVAALIGLLLLAIASVGPAPAYAESGISGAKAGASSEAATGSAKAPALPTDLTPAANRELLARLSDDQVRALLLQQLDKAAAAKPGKTGPTASGVLMSMEEMGRALHSRIGAVLAEAPDALAIWGLVAERLRASGGIAVAVLSLAIVLAVGFVARAWWRWVIGHHKDRIAARNVDAGAYASLAIIGDAFVLLLLKLSGAVIFYIAAMTVVFTLRHDSETIRIFLTTYVTAMAATLAVMAFTEFCLPRRWAVYRLLPLSDNVTQSVHIYVATLAVVWNFGFFSCELLAIYGADPQLLQFLLLMVATVFLIVLIGSIWSVRGPVARLIRGEAELSGGWGYLRGLLADSWHLLASTYMLMVWGLSVGQLLFSGEPMRSTRTGLISLLLFIAGPMIDIIIGRFLAAQLGTDNPVGAAIRRTLRVVIVLSAAAIFVWLWGIDIERLEAVGGWPIAAVFNVGPTALVGYAVWQLTRAVIDRRLEVEQLQTQPDAAAGDGEGGGEGATRAATVLPLLRTFALTTIAIMTVLTALSGLGVNIWPLLAGAGVVGIAIGFGAQALVRDIFSGIFFLIDDAFRMGEYIDIGDAKGTVEKISIRSFQLRHHNGPLNTIPFGGIKTLTNFSRDWVIMKLPLRLTYDTDAERVRKLIKKLGEELLKDQELGPMFLEPLKSQGVVEMDDSAMIMRVKFTTRPGDQFAVRKKVYARIRELFEKERIKFAHREVTVRVATDGERKPTGVDEQAALGAVRPILEPESRPLRTATDKQ
jgi:small-conductance mechanosensitive channel